MVTPAGTLAFSPEFEKAKTELQNAREEYATRLEEYAHLTGVVGKNLETEYMMKLGKKEHELFACQVKILQIKREIALFQAAANRGENLSPDQVRTVIKKEFAEYLETIARQQAKVKAAEQYFAARTLSPEESRKLQKLYHEIVRKLHPDLNPDLPAGAAKLWDRVQQAYSCNDWDELFLLGDMVEELLNGKKNAIESLDTLELIRQDLEKVRQKTAALTKQLAETRQRIPYSYAELLDNPAEVHAKRKALDQEIALHREQLASLRKIRVQWGA